GSLLGSAALRRGAAELRLRADALRVERGMPGSVVQPSLGARQEQTRASAGLSAAAPLGGMDWRAALDVQRQGAEYRDPDPPLAEPYRETVEVDGAGGTLSAGAAAGPLALAAGVEGRELRFRSTMLAEGAPRSQRLGAGWVQGRASLAPAPGWTVEVAPGLRADWSSLPDRAVLSPRATLAAGTARATLRLSAGSAFAPPALADQFFQEGVLARPNPDLRPERVRGEVEAAVELRGLRLGGAVLEAEAAAFRADVDGMVLWFPDHRFVWRPENFDVRRRGWEAAASARLPFAGVELRGGAAGVAVEYDSPVLSGQVVYRPRATASGSLGARLPAGFRGEVAARYVGSRRTTPGSALNTLPPFAMADVRLARALALAGWSGEATLAVENVLDRDAAMLVDHPYPGRSWSLGLRLRHGPRRTGPGDNPHTGDVP
ncbi:MAG TPA: TonB-dependent receptor, partial [Longimicrobiaceae bacterium]|nr:TonB-dependent receptor [Longimicrobiaceae bacterium]